MNEIELQWHKYPDEKPSGYNDASPEYFICAVEYTFVKGIKARDIDILCYIQSTDSWYLHENDTTPILGRVIAWMNKPELPNFI